MRWEPNPLYTGKSPWRMSRPLIVVWIAVMIGTTAYLIAGEHFVVASVYGAVSIIAAIYGVRRDWSR